MFYKQKFTAVMSTLWLMVTSLIALHISPCTAFRLRRHRPLVQQLTPPVIHGEGPHWDSEKNVLFFVDILDKKVYRYDPYTKQLTFADVGEPVGAAVPVQGTKNKFIIGAGTNLAVLTWNGENTTSPFIQILDTVDQGKIGNRYNDGKVDASGRLWIGTMGPEDEKTGYIPPKQGTLYRTTNNSCKLEAVIPNVSVSNGVTWSLDNRSMFYIDSGAGLIEKMDYDILTGSINNRRTLLDFRDANVKGIPDGMTIDNNGNLWVACFNGSQIICVNSNTGRVLYSIPMPVERVTSMTFGGVYFDILYVTTSRNGLTPDQLVQQPTAGALYSISDIPTSENKPPVVGHYNVPAGNCARIPSE